MAAGDVANRIRHGQHGQSEGERDSDEANAKIKGSGALQNNEFGGQHGATAAAEDELESSEEFGQKFVFQVHLSESSESSESSGWVGCGL